MNAPLPPQLQPRQIWSMRRPLGIGFVALALLILGFGLWSTLVHLAGAVVASGRIEVEQNRQIVQHLDGGMVSEVLVTEGQRVETGDVLLRLDGTLLASELAVVEGNLSETAAQRARLEAERDGAEVPIFPAVLIEESSARPEVAAQISGQMKLFEARLAGAKKAAEQLGRQIDQTRLRIEGIEAQSTAISVQLGLIQQELATQKGLLDRGLAQLGSVLALQREEARLLGQTGDLISTKAEAEERITEIELQIGRIDLSRREEAAVGLRDIGPQELELTERRRTLRERMDRLDVRAPVSGVVFGLTVTTPRAVLRAADPLLYLVPQDRPLVITAQIAPIDIDQIFSGQKAELVFSAFSSRTTPHLQGHVTVISADAFTDQQIGSSFYRVEILLDEGEIDKLGDVVLVPGMPVEAFIQTASRTPLTYLTKPFTDYFNRAFRES